MEDRVYHAGAAIASAIAGTIGAAAATAIIEERMDPRGSDLGAGDLAAAAGE